MAMTKPYNIQAPEDIAKEYGGNKQKIAKAAQMGLLDPTAAVLAGMFIDRVRSAQVQEQTPQPTVAEQTFAPSAPAPAQMQSPQRALGATPQAPQMAAMQKQMAPRRGVRGMDRIPTNPNMIPSAAGGGLVAFAEGGYPANARDRALLIQKKGQLETALSQLPGGDTNNPQRDAVRAELNKVNQQLDQMYKGPALDRITGAIGEGLEYVGDKIKGAWQGYGDLMDRSADALVSPFQLQQSARATNPPAVPQDVAKPTEQSLQEQQGQAVDDASLEELMALEDSFGGDARVAADRQGASQNLSAAAPRNNTAVTTPTETYTESGARGLMATNAGRNTGFKVTPTANQTTNQTTTTSTEVDPYGSKDIGLLAKDIERQLSPTEKNTEAVAKQGESTAEKMLQQRGDRRRATLDDFTDSLTTDTTLEDTRSELGSLLSDELGEGEKAALAYYEQADKRLAEQADKDMWAAVANFGFNLAASDSPYFAQAAGEAGKASTKMLLDQAKERKKAKQEAVDKRASFDVIRNDRKIQNLKLALGKYGADADRELKSKIAQLETQKDISLKNMSIDSQEKIALAGLITQRELQDSRQAHDTQEKALDRDLTRSTTALNAAVKISEGDKTRAHDITKQQKLLGFQKIEAQLEREFKGDENNKNRDLQERIARMQVDKPTDFTNQVNREVEAMKLMPEYKDTPTATLTKIAQDNVFAANNITANALKLEMFKFEYGYKIEAQAYKDWTEARMSREYIGLQGEALEEAKRKFIKERTDAMYAAVLGFGEGQTTGNAEKVENYTDVYPNQ